MTDLIEGAQTLRSKRAARPMALPRRETDLQRELRRINAAHPHDPNIDDRAVERELSRRTGAVLDNKEFDSEFLEACASSSCYLAAHRALLDAVHALMQPASIEAHQANLNALIGEAQRLRLAHLTVVEHEVRADAERGDDCYE